MKNVPGFESHTQRPGEQRVAPEEPRWHPKSQRLGTELDWAKKPRSISQIEMKLRFYLALAVAKNEKQTAVIWLKKKQQPHTPKKQGLHKLHAGTLTVVFTEIQGSCRDHWDHRWTCLSSSPLHFHELSAHINNIIYSKETKCMHQNIFLSTPHHHLQEIRDRAISCDAWLFFPFALRNLLVIEICSLLWGLGFPNQILIKGSCMQKGRRSHPGTILRCLWASVLCAECNSWWSCSQPSRWRCWLKNP